MKYLLTLILLFAGVTDPVTKISKSNRLKRSAMEAQKEGDYEVVVTKYIQLLDSMEVEDDNARLNLANAAYNISYAGENMKLRSDISSGRTQVRDSSALASVSDKLKYFDIADSNYKLLKDAQDPTIASSAFNQLGVISYKMSEQSPDEQASFIQSSLSHFKNALKKNPQNESARYNYELLKKLKQQQEEQQKDDKNQDQKEDQKDQEKKDQEKKDQENKDQENQEKKDQENQEDKEQEQKEGDEEKDQEQKQREEREQKMKEKLKEMNISEEKAKMILEAMKNNEIQYVQQNKRKPSKRKRSDKPDW